MCDVGLFDCEFLKYGNYMLVFVVFGLEGLSPIGVCDVLDCWTHDGHGTVQFSSAAKWQGVLSMVITCVGHTMGKELLCSYRMLLGK